MELAVSAPPTKAFRRSGCVIAAVIAIAGFSADASAQGIFESLFGGMRRSAPQMRAFTDPFANPGEDDRPRRESGGYASYCVRLCDGRHFPLPRGAANAAQLCQSFCPAAKTQIFSGSGIDNASAPDGKSYADLDNAFLYRDKLVPDCTCNGRSPMGLARLDAKSDPTLRSGDIVATPDGLMAYQGNRRGAEFTPVDRSVLSKEWRSKLSAVQVAPVHEEAPSDADLPKAERRRGQVSQ